MTLECGIRFLTDYLEGDVYFHIQRTGQNLDRCRTQCKLVADMEAHWGELEAIVNQIPLTLVRCTPIFPNSAHPSRCDSTV